MPRFVFWDCDNTLISNAPLHWLKHKETLARHGYDLPDEFRKPLFMNNGQQNWDWLVKNIGLTIPLNDYLSEIDAWYHAHIGELPLRDGIPAALEHFKTVGAKQCVVTNARRASVEPMLQTKNILSYFEFAWCKEDYSARKPDPMPYLSAIQRMEKTVGAPIDKNDCLAIEDATEGVEAALAAGIKVIHRRYQNDDPAIHEAYISVYEGDDFLRAIQDL